MLVYNSPNVVHVVDCSIFSLVFLLLDHLIESFMALFTVYSKCQVWSMKYLYRKFFPIRFIIYIVIILNAVLMPGRSLTSGLYLPALVPIEARTSLIQSEFSPIRSGSWLTFYIISQFCMFLILIFFLLFVSSWGDECALDDWNADICARKSPRKCDTLHRLKNRLTNKHVMRIALSMTSRLCSL